MTKAERAVIEAALKWATDLDVNETADAAPLYSAVVELRNAPPAKAVEVPPGGWTSIWWSTGKHLEQQIDVEPGSKVTILIEDPDDDHPMPGGPF